MLIHSPVKFTHLSTFFGVICLILSSFGVYEKAAAADAINTPAVDFWYGDTQSFGHLGNPQNWVNLVGNISFAQGSDLTIEYSLNGASSKRLVVGPDNRRLIGAGDFNIGIDYSDLNEGANLVHIAVSKNGEQLASKTATINYTSGRTWPFPYYADWGQLSSIQNVGDIAQVVDGLWELEPEGIRVVQSGYDLTIAIGDESWPSDYEVTVPFIAYEAFSGIGFAIGWQGHTGTQNPPKEWPLQSLAWLRGAKNGNPPSLEILTYGGLIEWEVIQPDTQFIRPVSNSNYYLKGTLKARSVALANSGLSRTYVKFWQDGESEPNDWMISADVPTRKGSVLLVAYNVDMTFGNVSVDALNGAGPIDTTPPSISNVIFSATDTTAVISWDTNEASTSKVNYGFDTNYQSSASDVNYSVNHKITLSNLQADNQYHFQIASTDSFGNTVNSGDLLLNTTNNGSGASGLLSDEFEGALNAALWSVYDPLSDSDISTGSTQLSISVPAGVTHNLWKDALDAPRIRQAMIDTDFHAEVKFDSGVDSQFQMQGLTVEQDDTNLLRLDIYSDGAKTFVFAASITDGNPATRFNTEVTAGTPSYLRVKRAGDTWVVSYSFDGAVWVEAGTFVYKLAATKMGIFAGNVGKGSTPAPAHTAVIDYFRVVDSGVTPTPPVNPPVDSDAGSSDHFDGALNNALWTSYQPVGDSSIATTGSQLTIGLPAGTSHDLWTGRLNAPRITQPIANTDFELEAKFDSTVTSQYQMQGIVVEEDRNNLLRIEFHSDGAVTNVFAASIVAGSARQQLLQTLPAAASYLRVTRSGDQWTVSYSSDGTSWDTAGSFNHSLTTTAAGVFAANSGSPAPAHTAVIDYFKVAGSPFDAGGSTPPPVNPGSGDVDNFDGALNNALWTAYQPVGDSTIATTGTQLTIALPAGTSHDLWTNALNAPRITRPVSNADFELEAKFDSMVSAKYQFQGILIEENHENLLRFEFLSLGSSTNIFAASIVDGVAKKRLIKSIAITSPMYLRITRSGDQWTVSYSQDGTDWIAAGSFAHSLVASSAGVFAGNHGNPAPAHTAVIDYFEYN